MIPTEVVLSPQSYAAVVTAVAAELGSPGISQLQLARHLSLAVSIGEKNADTLILKELTPDPCPICHHRLRFLREAVERFEQDPSNRIRCPMGHRYAGVLKIYHIRIHDSNIADTPIKRCPVCEGQNIQYLGPKAMFCLDCDWDIGMEVRY